jgi:hypothetical protein
VAWRGVAQGQAGQDRKLGADPVSTASHPSPCMLVARSHVRTSGRQNVRMERGHDDGDDGDANWQM